MPSLGGAAGQPQAWPDAGIVTFLHRAYNQHGDLVAQCRRSGLQRKRAKAG